MAQLNEDSYGRTLYDHIVRQSHSELSEPLWRHVPQATRTRYVNAALLVIKYHLDDNPHDPDMPRTEDNETINSLRRALEFYQDAYVEHLEHLKTLHGLVLHLLQSRGTCHASAAGVTKAEG